MRLHVNFEKSWLLEDDQCGSSPTITIFWECEGKFYPEEDWVDSGAVILGWWMVALERIRDGSKQEELVFMEGPYSLKLAANHQNMNLEIRTQNSPYKWQVQFDQLVKEVLKGANDAVQIFEELNIANRDRETLSEGVRRLRI